MEKGENHRVPVAVKRIVRSGRSIRMISRNCRTTELTVARPEILDLLFNRRLPVRDAARFKSRVERDPR